MTTFLPRVEGLEKSTQVDASAVRKLLLQRGLTPGKIADVRRLIAQLGELTPSHKPSDSSAYKEADAAQRAALLGLMRTRRPANAAEESTEEEAETAAP